jgi:type II secretory pathway pseudopilin PulG
MAGLTTALLIGGAALSATSSIMGANQQAKSIKQQTEFNAKVYEQQAEMVSEKKRISDYQFLRQSANARGTITSRTAGKGLLMGGSPLAILADTESNMQFDKAIADYNLDVEKNYALSGASYQRQTGAAQSRLAKYTGYSNAFSTLLSTGTQLGIMNMDYGATKGSTA